MSEETNGHNGPSRIGRIEKIVEVMANVMSDLQEEQRLLMRGHVLMPEDVKALTERMRVMSEETDRRFRETDERFRALSEAQTAMMGTVDLIVRRLP